MILSVTNSAVSSLLIFVVRLIGTIIICKGINSASLMGLSLYSLFLLGGFFMMLVFNYISYAFVDLFKKEKCS